MTPMQPHPTGKPRWAPDVTELLVFRYREVTAKGLKRDFVINVVPQSNIERVLWTSGIGRYRVEARDRARQVRRVVLFEVLPDGRVMRANPMQKQRKLPAPQFVA